MYHHVYLRKGMVYLPTVAKTEAGFYMNVEPVAKVSVSNATGLRATLTDAVAKENLIIPTPKRSAFPPPVLPKYAGVKTDREFMRGASHWAIERKNGNNQIFGYRVHRDGYWVQDATQKIDFPSDATTENVIEQMIAVLEATARRQSE